jgi:hypothetical protein
VQIDLPAGHHGVILSISRLNAEEWSADGRSDDETTGMVRRLSPPRV